LLLIESNVENLTPFVGPYLTMYCAIYVKAELGVSEFFKRGEEATLTPLLRSYKSWSVPRFPSKTPGHIPRHLPDPRRDKNRAGENRRGARGRAGRCSLPPLPSTPVFYRTFFAVRFPDFSQLFRDSLFDAIQFAHTNSSDRSTRHPRAGTALCPTAPSRVAAKVCVEAPPCEEFEDLWIRIRMYVVGLLFPSSFVTFLDKF